MARRAKTPSAEPTGGLRTAQALLWLLIVVAPWVFLRTAYDPFRLPKLVAAETLTLLSILALSWAWARRRLPETPRPTAWTVAAVCAPLLGVASLGLMTSDHGASLRQSLAALAIGLGGAAAWSLALPSAPLARLLRWSVVPAVGFALVGLGQAFGIVQPFDFETVRQGTRLAVTSFAGNTGELGAFLLLPAVVAQWRLVVESRWRWWWLAALVLLVAGQIVSQTLTALAALIVASTLFWWLAVPPRRRGLVAGIAVATGLVVALAAPPVRQRIANVSDGLTVGRLNSALTGRLDGWRVAGRLFTTHPVTGIGLGGFGAEFATTRLELQAEGVEFYRGHTEAFFANAHNDALEWAAETGLLGLAALAFSLGTLGRRVARWAGGPDRAFALAVLVAASLLALAYFPFRVPLLAYPYLLFLAWLLRATTEQSAEPAS